MGLSHEDVREILRIIDESELDELRVQTEGFSLHVRRGVAAADEPPATPAPAQPGQPAPPPRQTPRPPPPPPPPPPRQTPRPPRQTAPSPRQTPPPRDGLVTIDSPMLGTFYRAEAPGAPPFVEVGTRIGPDTIVCIIEVMKMMNSVAAGVSGTVVEVCWQNAELVEYGDPLFRVQPT
jgi:acetyl-CoA carboxylase biotin carboxyl carrier protein